MCTVGSICIIFEFTNKTFLYQKNEIDNNRRYETPTKSASRKLHEKCRNYRNIAPKSAAPLRLRSLYISRSVSSATFAKKCVHSQHRSSEVGFFDIFQKWDKSKCHQNYANEPCFPHLLTYRSSKHQHISCSRRGIQSHTIHMSFTTVVVYVFS